MLNNNSQSKVAKTLCGPYDSQFIKKFRGKMTRSISIDRLKLNKIAKTNHASANKNEPLTQNMLPKLKQLQKISKTERKKPPKLNKYLDGISDLQLYITNKLMNKKSTKNLMNQLSKNIQDQQIDRNQTVNQNYMTMTFSGQNQKFQEIDLEQSENKHAMMSRTDYTGNNKKKWVSDKDFIDTFDQFLPINKHIEKKQLLQLQNIQKKKLTEQQLADQLVHDKQQITKIAKKMIAEQNNETQQEQISDNFLIKSNNRQNSRPIENNIHWILRECNDYEKKFIIKKNKGKALSYQF